MKNILLLILFNVLLFSSCKSRDGEIALKQESSELPLKMLIIKEVIDSTYTQLLIPQKIELRNDFNKSISFSTLQFSLKGANIFSFKNPMVYVYDSDTLEYSPAKKRILRKNESKIYELYVGYNCFLNNIEKKKLLEGSEFSQRRKNKDVFNLINSEMNTTLLNKKIPDSLKGFIHLNYTNPKTNQFDYLNIPVKF